MKAFRNLFALVVACWVFIGNTADASGLSQDPFIQDAVARENFEPGGKYHLFDSVRGSIGDRTGNVSFSTFYDQRLGNLEMEKIGISGKWGYVAHFSYHGHDEHSPFDNYNSRSETDERGNVSDGFTMYKLDWSGHEHHPADGYDGPQGGGYPKPKGARDIYTYNISGIAQRIRLNSRPQVNDERGFVQRFTDHLTKVGRNYLKRQEGTVNRLTKHRPELNYGGEFAKRANGAIEGILTNNVAGAAELFGADYALEAMQESAEQSTMRNIARLSTVGKMAAVDGLAWGDRKIEDTVRSAWELARECPNTTEFAKLGINATAAATTIKVAGGAAKGVSKLPSATRGFVRAEQRSVPTGKSTAGRGKAAAGVGATSANRITPGGSTSGRNIGRHTGESSKPGSSGKNALPSTASTPSKSRPLTTPTYQPSKPNSVGHSGGGQFGSSIGISGSLAGRGYLTGKRTEGVWAHSGNDTSTTMKPSPTPWQAHPTPKQSEIDVGKNLPSDARAQVSYKNGREVPYGTSGSVRPDWCYGACSIEVKNYNIHTNRDNLIRNIAKQAKARAEHLPQGMQQKVRIDLRGQKYSAKDMADIRAKISKSTNGTIQGKDINFITEIQR